MAEHAGINTRQNDPMIRRKIMLFAGFIGIFPFFASYFMIHRLMSSVFFSPFLLAQFPYQNSSISFPDQHLQSCIQNSFLWNFRTAWHRISSITINSFTINQFIVNLFTIYACLHQLSITGLLQN